MRTFVIWPSATIERASECATAWDHMGYECLVAFDEAMRERANDFQMRMFLPPWRGYYAHVNQIIDRAFDFGADVVVCIGDDMLPEKSKRADQIASEFFSQFPDGYGVMQPCGDMSGVDSTGRPAAARICGSPWVGRKWAERKHGAFDSRYGSYYGDQALKDVAEMHGVLKMRPDLSQEHLHWSWQKSQQQEYHRINEAMFWEKDRAHYMRQSLTGFPGYA